MENVLVSVGLTVYQLLLFTVLLFMVKGLRTLMTTKVDEYALMKEYKVSAAGISLFGYVTAIVIIAALAFKGESLGILDDTIHIAGIFAIGVVVLGLNTIFVDGIILRGMASKNSRIRDEINKNNVAFGAIQAFGFIAAALQFYLSNSVIETMTLLDAVLALPYFILGQIIFVAGVGIFISATKYNDFEELCKGNLAVAFSIGLLMIAIAIVVGNASSQALVLDIASAVQFMIYSALSLVFMIFLPKLVSRLFVGKLVNTPELNGDIDKAVENGRVDMALLYGVIRIAFAIIIVSSLTFTVSF